MYVAFIPLFEGDDPAFIDIMKQGGIAAKIFLFGSIAALLMTVASLIKPEPLSRA